MPPLRSVTRRLGCRHALRGTIPAPLAAGASQTITVTGLMPGVSYYFAVRAVDEESNQGGLSNSPASCPATRPPLAPAITMTATPPGAIPAPGSCTTWPAPTATPARDQHLRQLRRFHLQRHPVRAALQRRRLSRQHRHLCGWQPGAHPRHLRRQHPAPADLDQRRAAAGGPQRALRLHRAVEPPDRHRFDPDVRGRGRAATGDGRLPGLPADNIWNTRVDGLPVHSLSSQWINSIGRTTGFHMDFGSGTWDGGPIGIPFNIVDNSVTKVPVSFYYPGESDAGPTDPGQPAARIRQRPPHPAARQQHLHALRNLRCQPGRQQLVWRLGRDLEPGLERPAPGRLDLGRRGRAADPAGWCATMKSKRATSATPCVLPLHRPTATSGRRAT